MTTVISISESLNENAGFRKTKPVKRSSDSTLRVSTFKTYLTENPLIDFDCRPFYLIKYPGRISLGSKFIGLVKTAQECEDACNEEQGCFSYQLQRIAEKQLRCFLQTNLDLLKPESLIQIFAVKEFVLIERCPAQPISCQIVFEALKSNIATPGSTAYPSATSEYSCMEACLSNSDCQSYQINRSADSPSICSLQTKHSFPSWQQTVRNAVEYFLVDTCANTAPTDDKRGCEYVFAVKYPGLVSLYADPVKNASTQAECQASCISDQRCVSYQIDLNPNSSLCWVQHDKKWIEIDELYHRDYITEYILLSRCGSAGNDSGKTPGTQFCVPLFENRNPGLISPKATKYPIASEEDCKATCARFQACVSYQVNRKAGETLCWLQYNQYLLGKDYLMFKDDVTEYVLVDRCHESLPVVEEECIVTIYPVPFSQSSANAILYPMAETEMACMAACVAKTGCQSVQMQNRPRIQINCALQLDFVSSRPENLIRRSNFTEYIIVKTKCEPNNACSLGSPLRRDRFPYFKRDGASDDIPTDSDEETNADILELSVTGQKSITRDASRDIHY